MCACIIFGLGFWFEKETASSDYLLSLFSVMMDVDDDAADANAPHAKDTPFCAWK